MGINILAIVQARMGSTRLPGKVLMEINGKPLIEILLNRLSKSNKIQKIIIATSIDKNNDPLVEKVNKIGFEVYRGSEENVLKRYFEAASLFKARAVVRITGDCPIIDPQIVDKVINLYEKNNIDYASNINPPTYPDGLDVEVFSFESLEEAYLKAKNKEEMEHVTPYLRNNPELKQKNLINNIDFSSERWTVDKIEDFEVIKNIINHYKINTDFTWEEIINLKKSHPDYFKSNKNFKRSNLFKQGSF